MKVSELIAELQKVDPDLEVRNFHVDCHYGVINGIEVVEVEECGKVCVVF